MRDYFLPHPKTHQKAHLLTWHGLVIYLLIFVFLQVSLNLYGSLKPGVLGINSQIDQAKVIELTNAARQKRGLSTLRENSQLDQAAAAKAKNMFEENYWAHYSPSGKDPWGFINGAGYKFVYAGENLARNFYTSDEVVQAWLESPSHRDNLLNNKYQDIGVAVVDGVLNGQKTTLVVQEFGSQNVFVASKPTTKAPTVAVAPTSAPQVSVAERPFVNGTSLGTDVQPLATTLAAVDPYAVTKTVGIGIMSFVVVLLLIDMYVMHRRAVVRISSRHLSHLSIISIGLGALIMMHPGAIL